MSENLREKFLSEIESADWSMLEQHNQRGAIFIVKNLDLVDVAIALAKDDTVSVKIWLENGNLAKPTQDLINHWSNNKNQELADFLIVQPYVIIKLKDFQ